MNFLNLKVILRVFLQHFQKTERSILFQNQFIFIKILYWVQAQTQHLKKLPN